MWGIVKLYGFLSSQYDFLEQKGISVTALIHVAKTESLSTCCIFSKLLFRRQFCRQTHTRFTGTAGRVHCVRIFTHFPCYEPACWSLNFMHFQTSVIRLVDRLTWFYRFGITLQINLSPKVCDLSVMFWINIYKLGLKKYPLKSRNFGNLVCLYLGYHGNYTRFICF